MPDLVNAAHKSALSQKNSEPSNIAGKAPSTDIGGSQGVDALPNTAKVSNQGTNPDTTIPKSVPGEKSHLGTVKDSSVNKANDVKVDFGDAGHVAKDDIDEALDQFENLQAVNVDILTEDDNPFAKKDDDGGDDKKPNPFAKKDDGDDDDKGDDKGGKEIIIKEDDGSDGDDSKGNPFAKKIKSDDVDDKSDDKDGKEIIIKEDETEGTTPGANNVAKEADEAQGGNEMNDGTNDTLPETFKVNIKLPNTKLFESVGVTKKNQQKIGLLFESSLKSAVVQATQQLHKHYKALHEEKLARRDAILSKQMDAYLNYVVEEWVKTNKVAIRQSLRSQLAEEFLNGLQRLFTEHYIDVPESKVDVVKQLTEQVTKLKQSLTEQTSQKMQLHRLAEAANKARIVAQFARSTQLSEEQTNKLDTLVENVAYTNSKEFREKLTMLRETYFPAAKKDLKDKHLTEETIQDDPAITAKVTHDPLVAGALAAQKQLHDANKW